MKTLLHLTPLAAVGGCEVNCLRLIKGLPGYRHRVVVFDDIGPMSSEWEQGGAEVFHLQAWRNGRAQFRHTLEKWTWSQDEPDGLLYWSSSRLPEVLHVLEKWNAPATVHLGNPLPRGKWLQVARRLWAERGHIARKGTTLAACSEHVARSHRNALYFRRYPIEVIYNPVDERGNGAHLHRDLTPDASAVIGMVGRLDSIKDQITIIRALAALAPQWPGLIVELAGDGALRTTLEQEAARLGVTDKVRLLGFVQTWPRLAAWDVYVHSTTTAEGMGTAVAEAMMEGLPCIVSDLPVMHEVCGAAAAYFPARNSNGLVRVLQAVLADRPDRVRLGGAAKERAETKFSIEKAARAYERLLFPTARTGETV
jgi:glycosyltransferase involved in cell wall biosynthesis